MTTYVALLRGINLGAKARIAMGDLRELFVALGYPDARTHLQTGNVVFTAAERAPSRLAMGLQEGIAHDLGVTCAVLLRTAADVDQVIAGNPYVSGDADPAKLYVTFLDAAPDPARAARLAPRDAGRDEFTVGRREIYLHCPDGYGRSKLSNAHFERRLGMAATTRSWRVVTKLHELAGGADRSRTPE